jgi:hypothetical protein
MQYPKDTAQKLLQFLNDMQQIEFESIQSTPEELAQFKTYRSQFRPIPSIKDLQEMLDVTFFSSLTQEEGQAVTFTLIYTDPDIAIKNSFPCIRFNNPFLLTTEQIRKLSPASPPTSVDIAVFPHDGKLKIWGLLYMRESSAGSRQYPCGLTITTKQIGTLNVKFNDKDLMWYSRGQNTMFNPDESLNASRLTDILIKVFTSHSFPQNFKTISMLLRMCSIALEAGSGATLIILPQDHEEKGLDIPKYEIKGDSRKILYDAMFLTDQLYLNSSVAKLLFIDGAVVYRETKGIEGFGAMIKTQEVGNFSIGILEPHDFKSKPEMTTLDNFGGGARHRSALIFCFQNPGALSIVISQDGVMSIMVKPLEEDFVVVIRPIRRGFRLA